MAINKNFVVKNGLEVSTDLIFADDQNRRVGILLTEPIYDFHVNGGIGVTDLVVAGVSTFVGVSTFSHNTYISGISTVDGGVSTGTTSLTVIGDLRVTGDINADDITFDVADLSQINVSGAATFGSIYAADGEISVGMVTATAGLNVTGPSTLSSVYIQDGNVNVGLLTVTSALSVTGPSTFTGLVDINAPVDVSGNVNLTGLTTITNLQAGLATEFFAATGIQSGGVYVGGGVTTINFAGVGATLVTVDGTTANVYVSGNTGISSVGIQSGGSFVGNATTLNFVGYGVSSVTINNDVAQVFIGVSTVVFENNISTVAIQTSVFNYEYNAGAVEVYYNGAKLVKDLDYVADNGSTVNLQFSTQPGDTVEIITYTNSISSIDRSYWTGLGGGIHTTGNVGIGTTFATHRLTIDGNAKVGVNTSQGVILTAGNGNNYRLFVENDGTLKTVQV
jgi:hypothetical protein